MQDNKMIQARRMGDQTVGLEEPKTSLHLEEFLRKYEVQEVLLDGDLITRVRFTVGRSKMVLLRRA